MQKILPSQSAECIFLELFRGSGIPLRNCRNTLLWTLGICMLYKHFWTEGSLNGMGQNILLLNFSVDV
jgi:hypothetical protein